MVFETNQLKTGTISLNYYSIIRNGRQHHCIIKTVLHSVLLYNKAIISGVPKKSKTFFVKYFLGDNKT